MAELKQSDLFKAIDLDSPKSLEHAINGDWSLASATIHKPYNLVDPKNGAPSPYTINGYNMLHFAVLKGARQCFRYILTQSTPRIVPPLAPPIVQMAEARVESIKLNLELVEKEWGQQQIAEMYPSRFKNPIWTYIVRSQSFMTVVGLLVLLDEPEMLDELLTAQPNREMRAELASQSVVLDEVSNWYGKNSEYDPQPLDVAVALDCVQCAKVLLQHGARVLDNERRTSDSFAMNTYRILLGAKSVEMARLLVDNGAIVYEDQGSEQEVSFLSLSHYSRPFPIYNVETFSYLVDAGAKLDTELLFTIFERMCESPPYGIFCTRDELVQCAEIVRHKVGDERFRELAKDCFLYQHYMLQCYPAMQYWHRYIHLDFESFLEMLRRGIMGSSDEDGDCNECAVCPRTMKLLLDCGDSMFNWFQWLRISASLLWPKSIREFDVRKLSLMTQYELCNVARAYHCIVFKISGGSDEFYKVAFFWQKVMRSTPARFNPVPFIMLQAKLKQEELIIEGNPFGCTVSNGNCATHTAPIDKRMVRDLYFDGLFDLLSSWFETTKVEDAAWKHLFDELLYIHLEACALFQKCGIHSVLQDCIMSYLRDSSSHYNVPSMGVETQNSFKAFCVNNDLYHYRGGVHPQFPLF